MKRLVLMIALLGLLVPLAQAQDAQTPAELCAAAYPAAEPETRTFAAAEQVLQADTDYRAIFCTSAGPVYVDLYEDKTPTTVNNFVFLAQQGYYNNINFHRVIQDFMAQGGDPTNTGSGGPGYQFGDEFLDDVIFDRPGLLAMANAGPATNGSQFFITTAATDWLNGAHTIFGEVVSGYENVAAIALRDPQQNFFPGTRLDTILIISDPATVNSEASAPAAATRADVEASWAELGDVLPRILNRYGAGFSDLFTFDPAQAVVLSTEDYIATVPEAQRAAFSAFTENHPTDYTAVATLTSSACDLASFPVSAMGLQMIDFGTPAAAESALADEAMTAIQAAFGFELQDSTGLPFQLYVARNANGCERSDLVYGRALYTVGQFLLLSDVIVTPDAEQFISAFIYEVAKFTFEDALWRVLVPQRAASAPAAQ